MQKTKYFLFTLHHNISCFKINTNVKAFSLFPGLNSIVGTQTCKWHAMCVHVDLDLEVQQISQGFEGIIK